MTLLMKNLLQVLQHTSYSVSMVCSSAEDRIITGYRKTMQEKASPTFPKLSYLALQSAGVLNSCLRSVCLDGQVPSSLHPNSPAARESKTTKMLQMYCKADAV